MKHDSIVQAFNNASKAINELEEVIREQHNTPHENIDRTVYNKIQVPHDYIRTRWYFVREYKLDYLLESKAHRDNIAYALMQSDMYNYIVNRFQIWGIIEKLFLKTALINIVAIQEALIICSLKTLHSHCIIGGSVCKYNSKCSGYVKSVKSLHYTSCISLFESKIGFGNDDRMNEIIELKDIRNNVHISLIGKGEFHSDNYTIANYNKAIRNLHYLKSHLRIQIDAFKISRGQVCTAK